MSRFCLLITRCGPSVSVTCFVDRASSRCVSVAYSPDAIAANKAVGSFRTRSDESIRRCAGSYRHTRRNACLCRKCVRRKSATGGPTHGWERAVAHGPLAGHGRSGGLRPRSPEQRGRRRSRGCGIGASRRTCSPCRAFRPYLRRGQAATRLQLRLTCAASARGDRFSPTAYGSRARSRPRTGR